MRQRNKSKNRIDMNITEKQKILLGAKNWVETNLPDALKLKNNSYSKILILSIIDCFAQMYGNYPTRENNNTFCKFVLKYSSQRTILNQVCPVTLHYHYKKGRLLNLQEGQIYNWDDPILGEEAERILLAIEDEKEREKAKQKHTYIKLLYQLRSKVVHELDNVGTPIEFNEIIPSVAFGPEKNDEMVWTLNYPRLWLYELARETIFGFIDDCLNAEEITRFLDNQRTTHLTWYV